jgi:hypothetical protein
LQQVTSCPTIKIFQARPLAQREAPCWNKNLNGLRAKTRKLFNIEKRTGQWDTHKETLTCYNIEIRKAKQSSCRMYCQEISDISGTARFTRILGKQTTNKVSIIKLPDGQYTQSEKERLKELFRVDLPDSKLIDDSYNDRQGQGNLGICRCITNRGHWNLAKYVINQSKIRWALGIFEPFKSVGTGGIVPALLQQGMEPLVPHLCRIFRACMA